MRILPLLLLGLGLACRSHKRPLLREGPDGLAEVVAGVGSTDISGAWVGGTGREPVDQFLTVTPDCRYTPPQWVLDVQGDSVFSYRFPEHWEQGVATKEAVSRAPAGRGRLEGWTLVLQEGSDIYRLKFEDASGHLHGTRNGKPFWAVRQQIVRKEQCPAVP